MKILFVREKWADGDPNKGVSDGSYMIATWQKANTADCWRTFYYDEPKTGKYMQSSLSLPMLDGYLMQAVHDYQPDIVMFSHLISWGERNIQKKTWEAVGALRDRDDGRPPIRVVGVWHESSPDVIRVADEHADCVDLNLFLDTKDQFMKYSKRPEKCLGLFDPRDATEFKPLEKTIGMLFNGTLVSRPMRCQGLFTLLGNGVPVTKIGGRNELFIPQADMVEMLGEAKICLNFSDGGQGKHYKGRVAEALLSECMLLEWENDEINSILTPFKEFVPFSAPDDLLQKAAYYLKADKEREKIAAAGRAVALEMLDGREFWKQLFTRLGL